MEKSDGTIELGYNRYGYIGFRIYRSFHSRCLNFTGIHLYRISNRMKVSVSGDPIYARYILQDECLPVVEESIHEDGAKYPEQPARSKYGRFRVGQRNASARAKLVLAWKSVHKCPCQLFRLDITKRAHCPSRSEHMTRSGSRSQQVRRGWTGGPSYNSEAMKTEGAVKGT